MAVGESKDPGSFALVFDRSDHYRIGLKTNRSEVKPSLQSMSLVLIALISGLVILIGYFIELPILGELRNLFLQWFSILAAIALIVGLVNLASTHGKKIIQQRPHAIYSAVLLGSMFTTLALGLIYQPTGPALIWIYQFVVIPVEASLVALLVFTLAYTLARLFHKRLSWSSAIFLITILIILAGSISFANRGIPGLTNLKTWVEQVWAVGGVRGILLGVALGTVTTGVRILLGGERPYQG
jgi:hypothetical protein